MAATLNFNLTAGRLGVGKLYRLEFEWKGASGGVTGSTNAVRSGVTGKVKFPLDPTIFVAVASHQGPGVLRLSVVHDDGTPLGPSYTIEEQIA